MLLQDGVPPLLACPAKRIHAFSRFAALLHQQPGPDWDLVLPLDGGLNSVVAASCVISLLCSHACRLEGLVRGPEGPLAAGPLPAAFTSGPLWGAFNAAARISLHPFNRLASGFGFSQEGINAPTWSVIRFVVGITRSLGSCLSQLLPPPSQPDDESEEAAGDLSAAELSTMPNEEGMQPAAARPTDGQEPLPDGHQSSGEEGEVRQQVLACVSAVRDLLSSEALDCLMGQLWHNRIPALGGRTGSGRHSGSSIGGQDGLDCAGGSHGSSGESSSGDSDEDDSSGSWRTWHSGDGSNEFGGDTSTVAFCLRHFIIDLFLGVERSTSILAYCEPTPYSRPMEELVAEMCPRGVMLSVFDVPTRAQAKAMAAGLCFLSQMRSLVARMLSSSAVASDQPTGCVSSSGEGGSSWSRWEVLQAALFRSLPPEQQEDWGRPLWCCNPGCTNLSGPSELQLKTYACGGGCGVRYCSRECQVQGWRLGHRHSCTEIAGVVKLGSEVEEL